MSSIQLPVLNEEIISNSIQNSVDNKYLQSTSNLSSHENSLSIFLEKLFSEQQYSDKNVKRALGILGDLTEKLSVEEIRTILTETEYL